MNIFISTTSTRSANDGLFTDFDVREEDIVEPEDEIIEAERQEFLLDDADEENEEDGEDLFGDGFER